MADFVVRGPFEKIGPTFSVLVEIEGGIWSDGRHNRGQGYEDDCEKYAEAAVLGWRVLRFTPAQVKSGYAIDAIKRALK